MQARSQILGSGFVPRLRRNLSFPIAPEWSANRKLSFQSACRRSYRAVPLVAARFAGAGKSPAAGCSTTVVEDDAHTNLPLLFATSSTIFVNNWSFTIVRLV